MEEQRELKTVDILLAYAWICESCNHIAYAQCEVTPIEELEEQFRDIAGLDDHQELPEGWRESNLAKMLESSVPDVVKCLKCNESYETVVPHYDFDEEECDCDECRAERGEDDEEGEDWRGDYDGGLQNDFDNI